MKKFIAISIFLLAFSSSHAQYSKYQGYMGKRFVVKYQIGTGIRATLNNKISLAYHHGPEIEYALGKKYSILGSASFQNSRIDLLNTNIDLTRYDNFDPNTSYISELKNTSILINLRKYYVKRGSFAPFGTYYGIMLGIRRTSSSYFLQDNYGSSINDKNIVPYSETVINPLVGAQFGRQFIFAKRAVVDAGLSINFPIGFIRTLNSYDSDEIGQQDEGNFYAQLFKFYVSVGFLAF